VTPKKISFTIILKDRKLTLHLESQQTVHDLLLQVITQASLLRSTNAHMIFALQSLNGNPTLDYALTIPSTSLELFPNSNSLEAVYIKEGSSFFP